MDLKIQRSEQEQERRNFLKSISFGLHSNANTDFKKIFANLILKSYEDNITDIKILTLREEFYHYVYHICTSETIFDINTIYHYCLKVVGTSCYGHNTYICDYRFCYIPSNESYILQTRKGVGIFETQIITNNPYAQPFSQTPPYNTSIEDPKNPWITIPFEIPINEIVNLNI